MKDKRDGTLIKCQLTFDQGPEGAEGAEGMEEYDEEDIAQMQKDLAKAEQQKAELEKLQKMQGGGATTPDKAGLSYILCGFFRNFA